MTPGTIDSKSPVQVLADYRAKGHPIIKEQAQKFKSLSPSDQRELLFHMLAHESVVLNRLTQQMEELTGGALGRTMKAWSKSVRDEELAKENVCLTKK
jgi:hypothetical protein